MQTYKIISEYILDLLFPIYCLRCGLGETYLCLNCQNQIPSPTQRCIVCARPSFLGLTHPDCKTREWHLSGVLVGAEYKEPVIQKMIWHYKYGSVKDIAEILSLLMADLIFKEDLRDFFSEYTIVPVPLHKRREITRGYNQAEHLARLLAQKIGLPFQNLLIKTKATTRQVDLEKSKRRLNVKGVFALAHKEGTVPNKILLIDDVTTTGATLNECAKVLKSSGTDEIWGIVVARN